MGDKLEDCICSYATATSRTMAVPTNDLYMHEDEATETSQNILHEVHENNVTFPEPASSSDLAQKYNSNKTERVNIVDAVDVVELQTEILVVVPVL